MGVKTVKLNDEEWEIERDKFTRKYLGVSADEFRAKLLAGEYDDDDDAPDMLMEALSLFPELDATWWPEPTIGPCVACGHDPACGFASVSQGGETFWRCHDDDHSCYVLGRG